MTYEFKGFVLGNKVKHPVHGIGEVTQLDSERGIIWCNYPNEPIPWASLPENLELIEEPILLPPCIHPHDNRITVKDDTNEQKSKRYNTGKIQTREVDPDFILGIGEVLTKSREKYEEGNWMNETKFSTPYESCMRHLLKFWNGENFDDGPDGTGKSHLLHAATNLMFLYYHQSSGKGIDDRRFKKKKDEINS
jgi:hypothetical protein